MVRLGSLEFGILANNHDSRYRSLIGAASKLPPTENKLPDGSAVWRDVSETEESPRGDIGRRTVKRKDKFGKDKPVEQVLIVQGREEDTVSGKFLTRASIGLSDRGAACVNFSFNSEGAMRFFRLTDTHKPTRDGFRSQLAIILDGNVHSAPNIESAIRDQGQITGNFSQKELTALVSVLNAGALELPIKPEPISEFTISPTLGIDVQYKGMLALWVSSLAVFVFMLAYYRFSGVVADVSLILNLVLILGSMAICNATFTLPGLAGMVLTIGMAVDTNVLIYERMREEMARGSSLRMTIHNGFDKALSAIVDSNITTLIAAVVLYMIGTDQIRGFAVTLFIGITMSMFSALYFGHLMFDIAERKRWVKELKMGKLIGVTSFDFIAKMKTAVTFSVSFIVLGIVLLLSRGTDSLDIDFSGGSMVTFQFKEPQQIDDVRNKLNRNSTFSTSMSLERLALADESTSAETGRQFRLRTKEQDVNKIRAGISETFADNKYELKRVTVKFTPPTLAGAKEVSANEGRNPKLEVRSSDVALSQSVSQLPAAQGDDELKAEAKKDDTAKEGEKTEKPAASEKPAVDKADEKKPVSETTDAEKKEPEKSDTDKKSDTGKKAETPAEPKSGDDKSTGSKTGTEKESKPADTKPAPKAPVKTPDEPELPLETSIDSFADGQRSELTFSSEITTSTAGAYLLTELQKINKSFTDPEALFRITGLEGSGMQAKEDSNVVRNFSKMLLETRNNVSATDLKQALDAMEQTMATTPIFEEVSNFASSVAEDMRYLALLALLASGVATIIYLWFRFTKADFGVAAVIAVFHDVLFVLATLPMAYYFMQIPVIGPALGPLLGLDDFKLNLSIVAAFLTIIGYSLNDTIVIFDRVREIRGRNPMLTPEMVNDSVNQTLSRTILTATTVFIVVAILYFVGGEGIHGFAFCMLVGTLVGTYSTVFIASPFLLWMMNRERERSPHQTPVNP